MEFGDPSEGYCITGMLPQICQHYAIHHVKIGVNKSVVPVHNSHVQ